MKHKLQTKHPLHHGGGMPEFEKDHWEKNVSPVEMDDNRYASEMNTEEEYKKSVNGLANYVKKHRAQH